MLRYLAKRVLRAIVTLLLVVTIAFFAVHMLTPYDAAIVTQQRGPALERVTAQLGLDRPLWQQWLEYMGRLVQGDLGRSYNDISYFVPDAPSDASVATLIVQRLPTTAAIFAVGGVLAYLLGEWLGRVVAWHRNRLLQATATTGSVLLFTAFPPWLVFLLVYFLTDRIFQARSVFGMGPVGYGPTPEGAPLGLLAVGLLLALAIAAVLRKWAHRRDRRILALAALPLGLAAFVIGLLALGVWAEAIDTLLRPSVVMGMAALLLIAFGEILLVMRAGVTAEMTEDYVFTARAKGLPGRLIRDRHVAPNAVIPAVSRFVTSIPYLLSGLIIIEREVKLSGSVGFGFPPPRDGDGLASLFFEGIEYADVPVILGILVFVGVIGLVLRIVLDMIQATIDPRIRIEGGSR